MPNHPGAPYTVRKLAKQHAEEAEAPLLFAALGGRLANLRSAAVFFAGQGTLAVALAETLPGLRVNGFELRQSAVIAARLDANDADLGERAVFARVDPRFAAYGAQSLIVVRYPVSEVADCEGALRAAAHLTPLLAVVERPGLESHVAQIALGLGFETLATARDSPLGPVLQLFEAR